MKDRIQTPVKLDGVTEYSEGYPVSIEVTDGTFIVGVPTENQHGHGRLVVSADNEGGYNCTAVDLEQLLSWVKYNMPNLWNSI